MSNRSPEYRRSVAKTAGAPAVPGEPIESPGPAKPINVWTYLLNHSAAFLLCLLFAHYLLVFELGSVRPYKMNFIFMLIAIPFGFDFYVCFRATTVIALLTGFVTAAIAIFAMAAVVWFMFGSPIIGGHAERRDIVESITAIMLAFAAGTPLPLPPVVSCRRRLKAAMLTLSLSSEKLSSPSGHHLDHRPFVVSAWLKPSFRRWADFSWQSGPYG
jgi:hypothetical protein